MRFEKRVNYVLVGLRRAGKSYLLYQDIQTKIHEKEITAEHILYINFEDERLLGMQTEELDNLLEAYRELYPNQRPWIYLDEIQNIIGWENQFTCIKGLFGVFRRGLSFLPTSESGFAHD